MLATCKVIGEIDIATAPGITARIRDTIDEAQTGVVVVDSSGVTFTDSAGFHLLVSASTYAAQRGHELEVRNMSPLCERVLRLCDWDHELRLVASMRGNPET
jgi:anti-anti-sigma factor